MGEQMILMVSRVCLYGKARRNAGFFLCPKVKREDKQMPNHVRNIVKMRGITALPLFTPKQGYDEKLIPAFDFEKVIPMPESLNVVSGTMEGVAVEAAIRKAASVAEHRFSGPKFVFSMTDAEYKDWLGRCTETEDELCKLGLQYIQNMVLYGAPTWYDWCIEHWGTKWNAYENEQIDKDTIVFETAWSAPEPVMAQLAKMYPNAEIEHWWADEDMGSNTGYARYCAGGLAEVVYFDNGSSDAYANYIRCWGESACLYQDEHGMWHHRNCDECHGCD